ncbi:hypothetical protein Tco_0183801 [Tanacetum coccineum]
MIFVPVPMVDQLDLDSTGETLLNLMPCSCNVLPIPVHQSLHPCPLANQLAQLAVEHLFSCLAHHHRLLVMPLVLEFGKKFEGCCGRSCTGLLEVLDKECQVSFSYHYPSELVWITVFLEKRTQTWE